MCLEKSVTTRRGIVCDDRCAEMARILLAVYLLLTPWALTHVASTTPTEDIPCGSPHYCRPCTIPYGGCTAGPLGLQPDLPPCLAYPTNYGRLQQLLGSYRDLPSGLLGVVLPSSPTGTRDITQDGYDYSDKTGPELYPAQGAHGHNQKLGYDYESYNDPRHVLLAPNDLSPNPYTSSRNLGYSYEDGECDKYCTEEEEETKLPPYILRHPSHTGSSTQHDHEYPSDSEFSKYPANINNDGYDYHGLHPRQDPSKHFSCPNLPYGFGYDPVFPKDPQCTSSLTPSYGYGNDGYGYETSVREQDFIPSTAGYKFSPRTFNKYGHVDPEQFYHDCYDEGSPPRRDPSKHFPYGCGYDPVHIKKYLVLDPHCTLSLSPPRGYGNDGYGYESSRDEFESLTDFDFRFNQNLPSQDVLKLISTHGTPANPLTVNGAQNCRGYGYNYESNSPWMQGLPNPPSGVGVDICEASCPYSSCGNNIPGFVNYGLTPLGGIPDQNNAFGFGTGVSYVPNSEQEDFQREVNSGGSSFLRPLPGTVLTPGPGDLNIQNDVYGISHQQIPRGSPASSLYEADLTSPGRHTLEEPSQPLVRLFEGCSVTQSQLDEIIDSFRVPEECVLTLPDLFSGSLVQFAHALNCFPSSIDVNDAFVLLPSGLVVPYNCYRHIASVYARDLPLFRDTQGVVLDNGQLVDSLTVASVVLSARSPQRRLIITCNDLVVPCDIFQKYIGKILPQEKKTLRVLLPGLENPISYETFEEITEKFVGNFHKNILPYKDKIVTLLGSKISLTLNQFLAVLNNYRSIKNAIVTLPNKKIIPLLSFIPVANVLGDDFTKSCLVNIPNTEHVLSFTVVKEIFKWYLENKFDLCSDTEVNWTLEGASQFYDPSDVEIFSPYFQQTKEFPRPFDFPQPNYLLCSPRGDGTCHNRCPLNVNHQHCGPPRVSEPIYACDSFDKYIPQGA